MSNEQIICFSGIECIYTACTQFNHQMDTCNFKIIGLLGTIAGGVPAPQTKTQAPTPPASNVISPHRTFGSLKPGDKSSKDNKINIKGTLKYDPIQREANTREGPKNVANALLEDETGQLSIAFWGDVACGDIMQYVKGDKLYIENLYKVNEPYEGVLKADAGKYFKMAKIN